MKSGWEYYKDVNGNEVKHAPKTLVSNVQTAEFDSENLQELLNKKVDNVDGVITNAHILNGTIDNAKLGIAAVGTANIQDAAITSAKIGQGQIENAHISDAQITVAKIQNLTASIVTAVVAKLQEVTAGTVQTNELHTQLIMAVTGEIQRVTAGVVTTNELYAQIIKAVCADLKSLTAGEIRTNMIEAVAAEIDRLDVGDLYASVINAVKVDIDLANAGRLKAAISQLSRAEIKDAVIDMAQVKDLIAGNAIFERGVGGEIYISNLAVKDASMVSLTTGELVVKGVDGKFYAITVNDKGEIEKVEKQITGDNVADKSLSGEKIIEKSITATQLNVQDIFADSALANAITVDNLNVASLFGSEAFIKKLKTHLINTDYLSVVIAKQDMIDGLSTYFDFKEDALTIGKNKSPFEVRISNEEMGFYQNGLKIVYISNAKARMTNLAIDDALTLGKYPLPGENKTGMHRFLAEANGSMSLVYDKI